MQDEKIDEGTVVVDEYHGGKGIVTLISEDAETKEPEALVKFDGGTSDWINLGDLSAAEDQSWRPS